MSARRDTDRVVFWRSNASNEDRLDALADALRSEVFRDWEMDVGSLVDAPESVRWGWRRMVVSLVRILRSGDYPEIWVLDQKAKS